MTATLTPAQVVAGLNALLSEAESSAARVGELVAENKRLKRELGTATGEAEKGRQVVDDLAAAQQEIKRLNAVNSTLAEQKKSTEQLLVKVKAERDRLRAGLRDLGVAA